MDGACAPTSGCLPDMYAVAPAPFGRPADETTFRFARDVGCATAPALEASATRKARVRARWVARIVNASLTADVCERTREVESDLAGVDTWRMQRLAMQAVHDQRSGVIEEE